MPAIQPTRLKHQANQLASYFEQTDLFFRELDELLELYTNRTYRPGVSGESHPSLLKTYNVPAPVLRQVQQELAPLTRAQPEKALELCRKLWEHPILEYRLLASGIIGSLPPNPAESIIACLREWIEETPEDQLLTALLTQGTVMLRRENPQALLILTENWLDRSQVLSLQAALRLLEKIASDPSFVNLPAIFARITPLVRILPSAVRPDMVALLNTLAQRSPSETSYFLRDNLGAPNNIDTPWLTRQVLDKLPDEAQRNLRQILREKF